jgi:hypothetical protein
MNFDELYYIAIRFDIFFFLLISVDIPLSFFSNGFIFAELFLSLLELFEIFLLVLKSSGF